MTRATWVLTVFSDTNSVAEISVLDWPRATGSVYDPNDPVGRLLFNVLALVAESDLFRMRTCEGMRIAKAKGHLRGKQPKLKPRQEATWSRCSRAVSTPSASWPTCSASAARPYTEPWPATTAVPPRPHQRRLRSPQPAPRPDHPRSCRGSSRRAHLCETTPQPLTDVAPPKPDAVRRAGRPAAPDDVRAAPPVRAPGPASLRPKRTRHLTLHAIARRASVVCPSRRRNPTSRPRLVSSVCGQPVAHVGLPAAGSDRKDGPGQGAAQPGRLVVTAQPAMISSGCSTC